MLIEVASRRDFTASASVVFIELVHFFRSMTVVGDFEYMFWLKILRITFVIFGLIFLNNFAGYLFYYNLILFINL
jgi:hypothetical protein